MWTWGLLLNWQTFKNQWILIKVVQLDAKQWGILIGVNGNRAELASKMFILDQCWNKVVLIREPVLFRESGLYVTKYVLLLVHYITPPVLPSHTQSCVRNICLHYLSCLFPWCFISSAIHTGQIVFRRPLYCTSSYFSTSHCPIFVKSYHFRLSVYSNILHWIF